MSTTTRAKKKPPTRQQVQHTFNGVLNNLLGVSPSEITPTASIMKDLGADELVLAEIQMDCEDALSVTLDDDAVEKATTVQKFLNVLYAALDI